MEPVIWKSRKFWIMVVDTAVSLATYFIGKYQSPEAAKDILTLVLALQPIIISVVVSITVQNVAGIKAEGLAVQAEIANDGKVAEAEVYNKVVGNIGSTEVEESEPE